ncbi:MAG: RNA-binding S4 domain-containing protein [Acidobacteria bacterium]|nr:RNA-binding S4 domain-containing protein [Acidobacteriota bacterium]
MRLDAFLKKTHLLRRRELAKELCEEGLVRVNGAPKKGSWELRAGDMLEFPLYNRSLKVRVLGIPEGQVPKGSQWSFVEVLEDKRLPVDEGPWTDPFAPPPKPPTQH